MRLTQMRIKGKLLQDAPFIKFYLIENSSSTAICIISFLALFAILFSNFEYV